MSSATAASAPVPATSGEQEERTNSGVLQSVRVTATHHALAGEVVRGVRHKRHRGEAYLVDEVSDGSRQLIAVRNTELASARPSTTQLRFTPGSLRALLDVIRGVPDQAGLDYRNATVPDASRSCIMAIPTCPSLVVPPPSSTLRAGFAGGLRACLTAAARERSSVPGRGRETALSRTEKCCHRHRLIQEHSRWWELHDGAISQPGDGHGLHSGGVHVLWYLTWFAALRRLPPSTAAMATCYAAGRRRGGRVRVRRSARDAGGGAGRHHWQRR